MNSISNDESDQGDQVVTLKERINGVSEKMRHRFFYAKIQITDCCFAYKCNFVTMV